MTGLSEDLHTWFKSIFHNRLDEQIVIRHNYRNLLKIDPPLKISPLPFNEVVAKGTFLSKVRSPIYAAVHAVILSWVLFARKTSQLLKIRPSPSFGEIMVSP